METELREAIEAARVAAENSDFGAAWELLEPHRESITQETAFAWAWLVLSASLPPAEGHDEAVREILAAFPDQPRLVELGAELLLDAIEGRPADEPIPDDDPSFRAAAALRGCLESLDEAAAANPEIAGPLWNGLGNALRLSGPAQDTEALAAWERALGLADGGGWWRFNLGLLYKQRGRWAEGAEVYRRVREEVGDEEAVLWNLAICATGAGDGEVAAEAWRALGHHATVGEDGRALVEGLSRVKVRLSTGGIGAAHPGEGPVEFEHVWVRPRSPCHGVVLNPTIYDVGVEFGDVVLWDGQPLGYATRGERKIPRFALLARLEPGGARGFYFMALQPESGAVAELTDALAGESCAYVFDEQVVNLCAECIRTGGPHGPGHETSEEAAPGSVMGKLVFVPEDGAELDDFRVELEAALEGRPELRLAVPGLYEALDDEVGRARHEKRWHGISTGVTE